MARTLICTVFLASCLFLAGDAWGHPAWGIAVDRGGQVYFSDIETVWKIDARGVVSVFRAGVSGRHTHDLNIDEAGNVYGADNSYEPATKRFFSAIWRMTPAGDFSYLLPTTDDPPEGTSIWRDSDGNTYHADNYPGNELLVLRRTPGGVITLLAGSNNVMREYRQGAPYSVGGMAFGPNGELFFTHNASASKLTKGGDLTALVRDLKVESASGNPKEVGAPTRLLGIAVDAQGNAFMADYGNRRVLKIAPDGRADTLLRAEGTWFPTGVALSGGELYILEEGHTPSYAPTGARVRKLSPDGTVTILATVSENGSPAKGSADSSAGESSSTERSERRGESWQRALYILLGAAACLFVLAVVVRRARKRMPALGKPGNV